MELISEGNDTIDLYNSGSGDVRIPLEGTATTLQNPLAYGRPLWVVARLSGVTAGATITWQMSVGPAQVKALAQPEFSGTLTAPATVAPLQFPRILQGKTGGFADALVITVGSDNSNDISVEVEVSVYRIDGFDANSRVDIGAVIGTAPTLTNDQINVNAAQVGGNTPQSDVATETKQDIMDALVDTLIAGVRLANGVTHGGSTAVLELKNFNVYNTDGTAVELQGSVRGINIIGASGEAIRAVSARNDGVYFGGGSGRFGLELSGAAGGISAAEITAILADTNELQTDWVNGGRLDLLLDAVSTHNAAAVVAALMADTSFTVGGTLTYSKLMRFMAALVAGNWRTKPNDLSVYQLLDADDNATPVLEMELSQTTPQRTMTIL